MPTKITDLNGATAYRTGVLNSDGLFLPDNGSVTVTVDVAGNPVAAPGGGGGGTGGVVQIDPAQNTIKIAASQTVGVTGTVTVSGPLTNAQALVLNQSKVATNRSGTITTLNVSQSLAASNTLRRYLSIQNISTGTLYVSEFGAATTGLGSYRLNPGDSALIKSSNAITIMGDATGLTWTASEVNA